MNSSRSSVNWPLAYGLIADAIALPDLYAQLRQSFAVFPESAEIRLGNQRLPSWQQADLLIGSMDPRFGITLRISEIEVSISGGPGRKIYLSGASVGSKKHQRAGNVIDRLSGDLRLCQVLVVDPTYSASQSIKDIQLFEETFGKGSSASLRKGPNMLPPPLERETIRIDQNPGRLVFRRGYIEGVSAEMWLGQSFWAHAACEEKDVLNADWLQVEDRGGHLHVIAWPEPFTSAEGEQGEAQRRLLTLLFGIQ